MLRTTKTLAIFALALAGVCFAGCSKKEASAPASEEPKDAREIVEEPVKAKMQYVRPELIDWQGAKVGRIWTFLKSGRTR